MLYLKMFITGVCKIANWVGRQVSLFETAVEKVKQIHGAAQSFVCFKILELGFC